MVPLPDRLDIYASCSAKSVIMVSKVILENLPDASYKDLVDGKDADWSKSLGCQENEVEKLVTNLISLWTYVAYFQPKLEPMTEVVNTVVGSEDLTKMIIALWSKEGAKVIDRLGKISLTPHHKVTNVTISTEIQIASNCSNERIPKASIRLAEKNCVNIATLTSEELQQLFKVSNDIQKAVDNLLE